MRHIVIIGFLIIPTLNSHAQIKKADNNAQKFGLFRFYQNDTIQTRLKEIVRTDSIKNYRTGYLIYKSYDNFDTIVQELKYYQWQSNSKNGCLTQNIFDKNGKIVLYELFNMEGIEIERYKYDYNNKGLLTLKEGFGSGEIGITIRYYYSETGSN